MITLEAPAERLEVIAIKHTPRRSIFSRAILFVMGTVAPITWYSPPHILVSGDFNNPFDPTTAFLGLWHGWSQNLGMGGSSTVQLLPLDVPYYGLLALFHALGLSLATGQLVTFCLIFGVAGVTMYQLLEHWFGPTAGTFAGAFVYMVNPFTLIEWHNGFAIELIAWGLAPAILLVVDRALSERHLSRTFWLATTGLCVLIAAPSSNPAAIAGMVIVPLIAMMIWRWRAYRILAVGKRTARGGALVAIALGVNSWWLLPAVVSLLNGSLVPGFSHQLITAQPPDQIVPMNAFDLLTGWGFWGWHQGYEGHLYFTFEPGYRSIAMRLIVVLPLFLGLIGVLRTVRSEHNRLRWLGISLVFVGWFLAAGFHGPFGIFTWAYNHIPGFVAFRSPWEHFGGIQWFGLALLISVAWSTPWIPSGRQLPSRWYPLVGAATTVCVMVAVVHPMYGEMFLNTGTNGQRSEYAPPAPTYTAALSDYLRTEPRCEVLNPEWLYETYIPLTWYRGGYENIDQLLPCEVIAGDGVPYTDGQDMANIIDDAIYLATPRQQLASFLGALGVSDVLVAHDYDFSVYKFGPTPAILDAYFSSQPFTARKFGLWTDYRIPTYDRRPAIYEATSISLAQALSVYRANDIADLVGLVASQRSSAITPKDVLAAAGPHGTAREYSQVFLSRSESGGVVSASSATARPRGRSYSSLALLSGTAAAPDCNATTTVSEDVPSGSVVKTAAVTSPDGARGVDLSSQFVIADCVARTVDSVESTVLRISFAYHHLAGAPAAVDVLEDNVILGDEKLPADPGWHETSLTIQGVHPGLPVEVAFYSTPSSSAGSADDQYADMEVSQLLGSGVPIDTVAPVRQAPADNPGSLSQNHDGSYSLRNLNGKTLLATGWAYDPGWHLAIAPTGKSSNAVVKRVEVNGYAMGWVIQGHGSYAISPSYEPQMMIEIGSFVALGSLLVIGSILIISKVRSRTVG